MHNLKEEVTEMLEENDFEYAEYSGCFDVIARRDCIFLLKILHNIDSFQSEQANNLKVLSSQLVACSFIIGEHTTRESLKNGVVYGRFEVPAVTPKTFGNIINNDMPKIFRFRGGLFAEISPEKLRESRLKAGLTQKELAENVGITKKSVYEHEKSRMPADYETVKKLERAIGIVTEPVGMNFGSDVKRNAKTMFEVVVSKDLRCIGFGVDFVHQSPFNIIASEEKFMVLSDAEENASKRRLQSLSDFSCVAKKPVITVTREEISSYFPSLT